MPTLFVSSSAADSSAAQAFMDQWDAAWEQHDMPAMAELHTEEAVTVNRFGTVVQGRGTELSAADLGA